MTHYTSNDDVPPYRAKPYPKRRTARSGAGTDTALPAPAAARPRHASSNPTYAEFIAGSFTLDAPAELLQA
jgi:hypothetical protein